MTSLTSWNLTMKPYPSCTCRLPDPGVITHWGRVTYLCVSKLIIIASHNGLSPGRRQAIIWINAGILFIEPLGKNFSEILIESDTFSFQKMHLKILSDKWQPFFLCFNVLRPYHSSHLVQILKYIHPWILQMKFWSWTSWIFLLIWKKMILGFKAFLWHMTGIRPPTCHKIL